MGVSIPSEQEYSDQRGEGFTLFPSDDYILEVQSVTVRKDRVDIYNKNPDGTTRIFDDLEVRFRLISFANGDELADENGDDLEPGRIPLVFDWYDPARVGLKPQPAKARKFFAFATGVELEDRIDIEDFQTLVGKRLIGVIIIKANQAGIRRNKVTDLRPIRQRRRAAATVDPVAAAAAKVTPVTAEEAKEVFADVAVGSAEDDLPF